MDPSDLSYGALTDLISQLRRRGYRISTEQCIAAQRLLIALAASGDIPDHPQKLGALLAPIFCTSLEEQKAFPQLIELWSTARPTPLSTLRQKASSGSGETEPAADSETARGRSHAWLPFILKNRTRLALLAIAGLSIMVSVYVYGPTIFQGGGGANGTQGNNGNAFDIKSLWFAAKIAVAIILGFLILYWLFKFLSRLQFKKGRARGHPELKFLPVEKPRDELTRIMVLRKTAQELRQRRQLISTEHLNVQASVHETIRNGSSKTIYHPRKMSPEYLVLIDRKNFTDQLALLEYAVIKRLINNDVYVESFYFQDDPRLCRRDGPKELARFDPDGNSHAGKEEASNDPRVRRQEGSTVQYFTLRELSARYPEHTLAILTDGAGLFDPLTGRPHRWLKKFSGWSKRALLTTESYNDDYKKRALTELGFFVLPAGRLGMMALGALARDERENDADFRGYLKPIPPILQVRPSRWLDDSPPRDEVINEVCVQLRDYLGDEAYLWLSACSVYPELDWNLTLLLRNDSADIERVDEDLRALVRLPWFRYGKMPDWLRRRLILDMPKAFEKAVRQRLKLLLRSARGSSQKFPLKFIYILDQTREADREDSSEEDYVFLSFMSGFRRNRLAVIIPSEVRSFILRNDDSATELYIVNALMTALLLGWLGLSLSLWVLTSRDLFGLVVLAAVPALLAVIYFDALLQVLRWERGASSTFRLDATRWLKAASWFDLNRSQTSDVLPAVRWLRTGLTSGLSWIKSLPSKLRLIRLSPIRSKAPLPTEFGDATADEASEFLGHPKGLVALFFTEFWERFSYYGMRAILILYMVASPGQGGLGFDVKHATSIYGTYTMAVYLTALPGGLVADYLLGARLAVFLGGIIIACGHFSMVFHSMTFFYLGMVLIAVGTGLLKPNISAMVGGLYRENDPRRDSGFSLFYMGINLGAVLAPLVCGYLAQSDSFKRVLANNGFNPTKSWLWGFGVAGIGMILGLIVFILSGKQLAHVSDRVKKRSAAIVSKAGLKQPLTESNWRRIAAIFIFFVFTIVFWAAYEQKGASLNLFANELVRTEIFGIGFPSSYLLSFTPIFIILLAPIFSFLWMSLKDRQPSSPAKFTLGLLFTSMAYLLMIPASMLTAYGKISPLWLVGLYFLEVCGELCLSPVGLSTVTKLAPVRFVGFMLGIWFLATSLGSKLAGYLSGFYTSEPAVLMKLYGGIGTGLLISAGILTLLTPRIKKLMGSIQ